jgi:hypothetical protein
LCCLRARDTGSQARDNFDGGGIEARVGVTSPKITPVGERDPDIRATIDGCSNELFGDYADDLERVALEAQSLAHHLGIAAQAANPICVRDNNGMVVALGEHSAQQRSHAKFAEEIVRDAVCMDTLRLRAALQGNGVFDLGHRVEQGGGMAAELAIHRIVKERIGR